MKTGVEERSGRVFAVKRAAVVEKIWDVACNVTFKWASGVSSVETAQQGEDFSEAQDELAGSQHSGREEGATGPIIDNRNSPVIHGFNDMHEE